MRNFIQRQQKGVTLLELLLVLIIIAAISLLAINRYQLYRQEKDIAALKQNVDILFQTTNIFYHVCCSASQGLKSQPAYCGGPSPDKQFHVDKNALKQMLGINDLTAILIKTSLATSENNYDVNATYQGQTEQTQKPIYQLSVSAILNAPQTVMAWYQQMLNASLISTNNPLQLVWTKFPSYTLPSVSSNLWIMSSGLREFKESATQQNGDDSCAY